MENISMKRQAILILIFLLVMEFALYLKYRAQLYSFVATQLQIKATDLEVNIFASIVFAVMNVINVSVASKLGRIQDKTKHTDESLWFINLVNNSLEVGNYLQIVYGPGTSEPQFKAEGSLKLSNRDLERKEEIIKNFKNPNYTDDACAAVLVKPKWNDHPLTIRYYNNTYAEIRALRHKENYVGIVSANVLIFSEELKCIAIHRRSNDSHDYPGALHTFGGAFIPPGSGPREDHSGLRRAAIREIFEEADAGIHIPDTTRRVMIDEFEIQFIQLAYLGVNVSAEQVNNMRGNWEGDPIQISFDDLGEQLAEIKNWTPTGWTHVLLWLGLDTPGASGPVKFRGLSGPELAKKISQQCLTIGVSGEPAAP